MYTERTHIYTQIHTQTHINARTSTHTRARVYSLLMLGYNVATARLKRPQALAHYPQGDNKAV